MTWLVLLAAALGAPIALPPGEAAADWVRALERAGLESGAAGAGEGVRVVVVSGGWELVARDAQGEERRVTVPVPHTPAAREEVAALAASLLHPAARVASMPLPSLPPLPAPGPAPAPVKPESTPTLVLSTSPTSLPPPALPYEPPPAWPYEAPLTTAALSPPDPDVALPVAIAPPAPRTWGGGGVGVRARSAVGTAVVVSGWVGRLLFAPLPGPRAIPSRVGAGVELAPVPVPVHQLPDDGGARKMSAYDGNIFAAWSPAMLEIGGTIGLSLRVSTDPTDPPPPPWLVPTAGPMVAARFPFVGVPIRIAISGEYDLVGTDLFDQVNTPVGRLPRWSGGLSVSIWSSDGSNSPLEGTAGASTAR